MSGGLREEPSALRCATFKLKAWGNGHADTGQPSRNFDNLAAYTGYEATGCAGSLLIAYPMQPRMPFSLGEGKGYRVRGDRDFGRAVTFRSVRQSDGACVDVKEPRPAGFPAFEVSEPSLEALPTLPFKGPLHVERR